tara:strand:+ start:222 stop:1268 length:1047 start_codon:yes stop_codon:yes gene_type:complete
MSTSPKAAGGIARAAKLSPERRKEIADGAREAKARKRFLPVVILKGEDLNLAGIKIPCAIVAVEGQSEPMRILTENGITNALLGSRSGASKRLKKLSEIDGAPLPLFLAPSQLNPFIDNDLRNGPLRLVEYVDGDRIMTGYSAEILPAACEIWLRAREAGALQTQQLEKAQKAELLTRALARIGIISLVDEATGYEKFRAKNSLAKILEAYVAKELQPYVSRFPPEFYQEIFRLRGLSFPTGTVRRPQYFGHITNDLIYRRLAPGVWRELKAKVEKDEKGRAKHKLFQHLTPTFGDPRLEKLITRVTTIMEFSSNWGDFKQKLDAKVPAFNETMQLPFDMQNDDGIGI